MLWAYAKLGLQPESAVLAEWVGQVRTAHERKPLLAADARNLERALHHSACKRRPHWHALSGAHARGAHPCCPHACCPHACCPPI